MSPKFPTIDDFFQHTLSPLPSPTKSNSSEIAEPKAPAAVNGFAGDGFTSSERSKKHVLSQGDWQPQHPYDHASVGQLSPGPRRVCFTARVINLYDRVIQSKLPKAAKGCLKVLVRDDNAALLVNLWYAQTFYDLRLGSLITIWTTHISPVAAVLDAVTAQPASLLTSIFPERDVGCHILILRDDEDNHHLYRRPLALGFRTSMMGLVSLGTFLEGGGSEIHDAKVLVYVKAVSPPSIYTSTNGRAVPVRDLGLADGSSEAILHLFGRLMHSAENFESNHTVLLISYPGWRPNHKLSIKARTQIDVEPLLPEAEWLRQLAMQANQAINEPAVSLESELSISFPLVPPQLPLIDQLSACRNRLIAFPAVFHASSPSPPLLHNLATFSSASSISSKPFTGYLALVIMRLHLAALAASRHLFCMEHCHMPIYSNALEELCGQCGSPVSLRINPAAVGGLVDETGCLIGEGSEKGRLIWTDESWTDLFGRQPEAMAALASAAFPPNCAPTVVDANLDSAAAATAGGEDATRMEPGYMKENQAKRLLAYLEHRLTWMRIILLAGWTGKWGGGRLVVLKVVG